MDRTHGVSRGVGRSQSARGYRSSGSPRGAEIQEPRRRHADQTSVIDLYDLACKARLSGVIDPRLREFVDTLAQEPKRLSLSPEEPCNKQVNEYTVLLTVRGVENCASIVKRPNQPLTLSEAIGVYTKLSRDFVTCSHKESLIALDSLQDFFALMLRYPIVPQLAMDTKECPECYFETEITVDTWEEVRRKISCYHFTLRHEQFVFGEKGVGADKTRALLRIDNDDDNNNNDCEMVRVGPCGSVFSMDDMTKDDNGGCGGGGAGDSLKPIKFLEQLESLKRRDEITKQKTLGKDILHQLKSHIRTLEELEAPRYLSDYPLRCLYQFYGSLNRSRERAQFLSRQYPESDGDGRQARLKVGQLRRNLRSTSSTGTNDKLLSYMCMAMIGPVRRYNSRYNVTAERVMLFKHLIASGFPIETASSLVKTITTSKRASLIALPLEGGVELQLKRTVQPTAYNRKIASLMWLFSHITAYCTLRQLTHGYVRMGDSPEDMRCDGIYVFDQDHVRFRLSRASELSEPTDVQSTTAPASASAYMPFSRILEVLALRDSVQERLYQSSR